MFQERMTFLQEFECGVQFEGTENSKQEWSFTLYDFDGHGRITKEAVSYTHLTLPTSSYV